MKVVQYQLVFYTKAVGAMIPHYDYIRNKKKVLNVITFSLFCSRLELRSPHYLSHYVELILGCIYANIPQASLCNCFVSYMPVFVHLRGDLYPAKPQHSRSITTSMSPKEDEPVRRRARVSPSAGSEITNSIVFCW